MMLQPILPEKVFIKFERSRQRRHGVTTLLMKTLAATLTPPGRGAIATIVLCGPDATNLVARHFFSMPRSPRSGAASQHLLNEAFRPSVLPKANRLRYGIWSHSLQEEVVLCSTSSSRWEIHCHGGQGSVAAILALLEQESCVLLDWRQFLAATESHDIRAEALQSLAGATTQRTAGILLDQYHGALQAAVEDTLHRWIERGQISPVRSPVDPIATQPAAAPKHCADGLVSPRTAAHGCDPASLRSANPLDQLLAFAPLGLHLLQPWQVVITGRPNVGKSSLINALLGYERAITSALPGTTRDLLGAFTAFEGWPVTLIDTAGLHRGGDELEQQAMRRARALLGEADLRILVLDQSLPLMPEDHQLLEQWPDALRIANKIDLPRAANGPLPEDVLGVSAKTGEGLERLIACAGARLAPVIPPPGVAIPFTRRQVDHLQSARQAMAHGQEQQAAHHLRVLLGEKER